MLLFQHHGIIEFLILELDGSYSLSRLFILEIFAVFNDHFAVDKDFLDARGAPGGFPDGRIVSDGVGVEYNDIGKIAGFNFTPLSNIHPARGLAAHLADRFTQPQDVFVPGESAEDSRKRTV